MSAIVGAGFPRPTGWETQPLRLPLPRFLASPSSHFPLQHMSPRWGFKVFAYPVCYKHVAPLGLNTSRFPVLNPANPSILSILIQTTNALRNQPNRDTICHHSPQRRCSTVRVIIILFLLLLAAPAFSELTKEDLRTIIKEEVRPIIKEEITASEKRMKEYIDLKIETVNAKIDATNARIDDVEKSLNARIDNVEKSIDALDENLTERIRDIWLLVLALIGLIAAAIVIPQLIIAYREKGQKQMQTQIDQLREKIEAMSQ